MKLKNKIQLDLVQMRQLFIFHIHNNFRAIINLSNPFYIIHAYFHINSLPFDFFKCVKIDSS
jgi:hypothetical protein